jgi:hypothetical protein
LCRRDDQDGPILPTDKKIQKNSKIFACHLQEEAMERWRGDLNAGWPSLIPAA